jgi:hypothetical protein
MNVSEAKFLVELLHPGFKQIAQAAMDNVSEAVAAALKESRENTDRQLREIVARLERLEKRE